jgi:hypothetical protein
MEHGVWAVFFDRNRQLLSHAYSSAVRARWHAARHR